MEAYQYVRSLAEGSYGEVHACKDLATGSLVAIKRIKAAHLDRAIKRLIMRELRVLQSLPAHVNVMGLRDVFRSSTGRVYFVFELFERSLLQELDYHPKYILPADMAKLVAWQLLRALEHCHKQGVVHRDVKPANVLIGAAPSENADSPKPEPQSPAARGRTPANGSEGEHTSNTQKSRPPPKGAGMLVKLCDFGLARYLPKTGAATDPAARAKQLATEVAGGATAPKTPEPLNNGLSSYVVTRWYRAPEVIISCEPYDTAVDIWSFGCTLAELMSGTPLFPGSSSPDQLWRIMRCCGALADRHAAYLRSDPQLAALAETPPPGRTLAQRVPAACPQMLDLINVCLNMDPLKRPTATQLLQHPFFADVPELLAADAELQQLLEAAQSKVPLPLQPPKPAPTAPVLPPATPATTAAAAPGVSSTAPCVTAAVPAAATAPAAAAAAATAPAAAAAALQLPKSQTPRVATPEATEAEPRATASTSNSALPSRGGADADAASTSTTTQPMSAVATKEDSVGDAQPRQPAVAPVGSSTASPTAPHASPPANASAVASADAAVAAMAVAGSNEASGNTQEQFATGPPPRSPAAAATAAAPAAVSRIPAPGTTTHSASLPPRASSTSEAAGALAAAQPVTAYSSARLPVGNGGVGGSSFSSAAPCTCSGALATASNATTAQSAAVGLMVASGSGEYLQDLATQTASGGASAGAGAAQRAGMRVAPASGSFSGAADTAQDAAPPASQPATSNAGANKPDDTSVLADTSAVGKAGAASAPPAAEPTSPAAAAAKRAAAGVAAAPDAHLAPPLLPAAASTRRGRLPPLEVQGSEAESASGSEDVSPPAPRLSARASTLPAAATATAAAVAAGVRVRSAEEGAKRGSSQEATAAAPAMLNMTTSSLAVASEADAKGAAVASLHRPEDLLISPRFGSGAHSDCLFTMATGASRASEVAWIAGGFEGVDVDCASQPASQAPFLQPRPPAVPGAGARPSPSQPSQQQHIMPCRAGWSLDGRSSLRKLPSGYAGATASTGGGGGGAPPLASAHGMSCVLGNASNSGMPPSTFARATVGPSTSARASGILQLRQSMSGLCPVNEDQQHLHPLDTPMGTGGGGSSSTRLPPLLLATAMRSSARGSAAADAVASMLSGDLGSLGGSGSVGGSSNSCAPSASHLPWVLTPSGAPVLLGGGHHRRLPHQRPPPLVEPYVPPALGTYDSCAFPSGTLSGLLSGPLLSGVLPSGIFSTSGGADNGPGSFGLGPSLGSLHTYSPSAFHGRSSIPGSRGPVTPRGAGAGAGGAGGSGPGIGTRYVTQVAHLNSLADRMAVAQQSSASGGANSGPNSLLGLGQRPAPQTLSGPMTHWPVADGCVLEDSGVLLDCNSHHMRDGSPHAAALDPATIEHAAANAAAANYLATRRGSLHGAVGPHSSGNHAGSGPNNIGKYQTGSGPNSFGRHSVSGTPAVAGLAPGGSPADSQQLIFRVHSVHSAAAVGSNVAGASSGGVGGISASASVTGDYADQPSPFLLGMHSAGVSGAGSGSTHAAPNFSRMSSSNLEMQRSAGSGGMGSVGLLAPQPPSQPQQQSSSRFTRQSTTSVASSNHSVCSLRRGPSRLGQAPGSTAGGMNPSLRFALTRTTSHGLSSNTASASGLDGGDALTSVAVLLHTRSSYNCATYCSASMDGSGAAAGGSVGAVAGAAASGSGMVSGTMSDCGGVEGVGAPSPELDLQQGQRSAPIRGRALKIGGSPDPYDVMELMLTDPLADPRKAAATAAVAAAAEAAVTSMAADAAAAAARRAHAYSAAGMWPAEDRSAVATQSSPRAGAGWATFVAEADAQAQPEGLNHVLVSIDEMAGSATTLVRVGELGMARRPTSLANMHAASPILLGGLMPGDDGTPAPIPAGSGHSSIAMHGGGDIDRACNSRRSVVSIASAVLATPYSFTLQPPGVAGGAQGATTGSEVSGAAAGANDEAALVGPSGDADSGAYAPLSGLYTTSRLSMGAATAEDEAVAAAAKRRASSSGVNTFSRLASGFRKKVEKLKKVLS